VLPLSLLDDLFHLLLDLQLLCLVFLAGVRVFLLSFYLALDLTILIFEFSVLGVIRRQVIRHGLLALSLCCRRLTHFIDLLTGPKSERWLQSAAAALRDRNLFGLFQHFHISRLSFNHSGILTTIVAYSQ